MQIGQLYKIFEVLGTPDESTWPGVAQLPDWQPHFPHWAPKDLYTVRITPHPESITLPTETNCHLEQAMNPATSATPVAHQGSADEPCRCSDG